MLLKHRDRELLRFEWIDPQGVHVVSVNESERKFLPLEMKGVADDNSLWSWLSHRTVPRHRNYIQRMLGNIGIGRMETRAIIELCKGLSLNDVFGSLLMILTASGRIATFTTTSSPKRLFERVSI